MENFATTGPAERFEHSVDSQLERQYENIIFPSLVARIKALFVDFIFLLLIFAGTSVLINAIGGVPDFVKGSIAVFMLCLYDPILTSFTGSTLGHKALGLGVRKYKHPDSYINFGQALIRFSTKG